MTDTNTKTETSQSSEDPLLVLREMGMHLGEVRSELRQVSGALRSLMDRQGALEQDMTCLHSAVRSAPPVEPMTSQGEMSLLSCPMTPPERYAGEPETCETFLLQCDLYLASRPPLSDRQRIAFILGHLKGKAGEWGTAVWSCNGPEIADYERFRQSFCATFNHPHKGQSCGDLLRKLQQGSSTTAQFVLSFRTLAARSGWNNSALISHFRAGLRPEVRLALTGRVMEDSLEAVMTTAIQLDYLLTDMTSSAATRAQRFRPQHPPQEAIETPMQVDSTHLKPAERSRRIRAGLCLYCGGSEHQIADCSVLRSRKLRVARSQREKSPSIDSVRMPRSTNKLITVSVVLLLRGRRFRTRALVDSGAEGNFLDLAMARRWGIQTVALPSERRICGVDGRPAHPGFITHQSESIHLTVNDIHREHISFFLMTSPAHTVILGLPWLERHDPYISWSTRRILQWAPACYSSCISDTQVGSLSIANTQAKLPPGVPAVYSDLAEVFNIERANSLPPHREYDCAIDLIDNAKLPRVSPYALTVSETRAMQHYISEALKLGHIQPSKSPVASGFFFVPKGVSDLRPCIDYRALNQVTRKYAYPLPLIPSTIERLGRATVFTKLDLRNAYNLVRIRAGDEWKTAFITTSGHYEYRVMPFGLANAPAVFQAFVNDVLREFLDTCVVVYIDDILVYSTNLESHRKQVRAVLRRLLEHNLYVKGEKCEFERKQVKFLGYVISASGMQMDTLKVRAIHDWPKPTSLFATFPGIHKFFIGDSSAPSVPLLRPLQHYFKVNLANLFGLLRQRGPLIP